MTTTTIHRPYDSKPIAERTIDTEGIVWERRLLLNGPGSWYITGAEAAEIRYPAGTIADTRYGRNATYPAASTCRCGIDHPRNYTCNL